MSGSESVEPQRALERQAADPADPGIAFASHELVDAQAPRNESSNYFNDETNQEGSWAGPDQHLQPSKRYAPEHIQRFSERIGAGAGLCMRERALDLPFQARIATCKTKSCPTIIGGKPRVKPAHSFAALPARPAISIFRGGK